MMRIDVISDSVCPWCFIGKRRLEQALALRPHIRPEINWRAFLLNPEIPPEGQDRSLYLVKKFGSESRVRRIYGAIADAGLSVEIDFAFERIDKTPNSVDSHRLVRQAQKIGAGRNVVEALFSAFFLYGLDIGDKTLLTRIGVEHGMVEEELINYLETDEDVSEIYDENANAHRLGVNGVPAFVFNDNWVISGAQEPQVLARMLDAADAAETAA
jgi:predicted DsbA family dithiol-disulfide isomerase